MVERPAENGVSFNKNGWMINMKVKYIGEKDTIMFERDKAYSVIDIEKGWYRIKGELEDTYLFPPKAFIIVERPAENGVSFNQSEG